MYNQKPEALRIENNVGARQRMPGAVDGMIYDDIVPEEKSQIEIVRNKRKSYKSSDNQYGNNGDGHL